MEFLKEYWYWGAAVILMVADHVLKKKKPQIWWRLQVWWNTAFSLFSLFFVGVMCYACQNIWAARSLKPLDRWFYIFLFGGCALMFAVMNVKTWRDWRREKKRREEQGNL